MSETLLQLESIEIKSVSQNQAIVCGAGLQVNAGEITALVGESGSGKTMTRNCSGRTPKSSTMKSKSATTSNASWQDGAERL